MDAPTLPTIIFNAEIGMGTMKFIGLLLLPLWGALPNTAFTSG